MGGLSEFEKQAESVLGITHQIVGKTQARREFFPLVDSLASGTSAVAITDHNKPVAILLSYHHYLALAAKLGAVSSTQPFDPQSMLGSVRLNVDDLEDVQIGIEEEFSDAIARSAESL